MIYTDKLIINGKEFIRTYSDACMVERDGVEYEEAIDPAEFGRVYVESANALPDIAAGEALAELLEVLE